MASKLQKGLKMTFAKTLTKIRKDKEMSVSELATLSGLTEMTIYNYEKGLYLPSYTSVGKLATALKCDYDLLYEALATDIKSK